MSAKLLFFLNNSTQWYVILFLFNLYLFREISPRAQLTLAAVAHIHTWKLPRTATVWPAVCSTRSRSSASYLTVKRWDGSLLSDGDKDLVLKLLTHAFLQSSVAKWNRRFKIGPLSVSHEMSFGKSASLISRHMLYIYMGGGDTTTHRKVTETSATWEMLTIYSLL